MVDEEIGSIGMAAEVGMQPWYTGLLTPAIEQQLHSVSLKSIAVEGEKQ